MVRRRKRIPAIRWLLDRLLVLVGSAGFTLLLFLVLPVLQAIGPPPEPDVMLSRLDPGGLPPPPPPTPEDPQEDEPEEEPPPPKLEDELPPLDLTQLADALTAGTGSGWSAAGVLAGLGAIGASGDDVSRLFSMSDLDQEPRVTHQTQPMLTEHVRKKAPGSVRLTFVVNERGRVEDPRVLDSTHPVFETPALTALKQWRFEPGKRNGEAVPFRCAQTITFPAGL